METIRWPDDAHYVISPEDISPDDLRAWGERLHSRLARVTRWHGLAKRLEWLPGARGWRQRLHAEAVELVGQLSVVDRYKTLDNLR